MRWLVYLFREAWANLRVNHTTTVVAIVTTAFTLTCVGIFLLSYVNLRQAADWLQEDIKVIVYLDDRLSRDAVQEIEKTLKADRMVGGLQFISKDQALGEFRAQFPSDSHLLEGLGDNPLPASFVVTPAPNYRSLESVNRWAERVKTIAGVEKVDYNQEWIDALAGLIRYIELAAISVGVILSMAAITIIGNTIRLALFARREEIEILRLIGATRSFIRIPYVIEGAVLGVCGSALSLGILKLGFEFFRQQIGSVGRFSGIESLMAFLPISSCAAFVAVGMVLGVAGSMVSLRRFGEARG